MGDVIQPGISCEIKEEIKEEVEDDYEDIKPELSADPSLEQSKTRAPNQLGTYCLPNQKQTCDVCGVLTANEAKLIAHKESKHKIFNCRFCQTLWPNKFEQAKHLQKCDALLALRQKIKKQTEEKNDPTNSHIAISCMLRDVRCPLCRDVFDSMFSLEDRSHTCRSYAVGLFSCSGCCTSFSTAKGLKGHLINQYNEKVYKCFNKGFLSYGTMRIPKLTRKGEDTADEIGAHTPVTLRLVEIKQEPTEADEMHSAKMKNNLVAAHILSEFDGTFTEDYYNAMRRMFLRVKCPFCDIECRTLSALHSHSLMLHPPHQRCLYQCGGCTLTYQTPTGLGQHLKREFDQQNAECFNTVNLVRKEDYFGQLTSWNKKDFQRVYKKPVKRDVKKENDVEKQEDNSFIVDRFDMARSSRLRVFPPEEMEEEGELKAEPTIFHPSSSNDLLNSFIVDRFDTDGDSRLRAFPPEEEIEEKKFDPQPVHPQAVIVDRYAINRSSRFRAFPPIEGAPGGSGDPLDDFMASRYNAPRPKRRRAKSPDEIKQEPPEKISPNSRTLPMSLFP